MMVCQLIIAGRGAPWTMRKGHEAARRQGKEKGEELLGPAEGVSLKADLTLDRIAELREHNLEDLIVGATGA